MNLFAFTVGKLSAFGNFLLYTVMTDQNVNINKQLSTADKFIL